MKSRITVFPLIVCAVLLLAGSALYAAPPSQSVSSKKQASTDTLDQAFTISSPKSPAQFNFRVTSTGLVNVDLSWKGPPLSITLKNAAGQIVASATGQSQKTRFTYNIQQKDVQKDYIWTLSISARDNVTGKILIVSPKADPVSPATLVSKYRPPAVVLQKVTRVTPKNPTGFMATAGTGGDVILKWNPVPDAIYYNLQGHGVQAGQGMNVSGTTHTVKGLPGGEHSWLLYAVYRGPSGPYFGDESNPARTSIVLTLPKTAWYAFHLTGFQVQQATYDNMLNSDGWGDEVLITMDVTETSQADRTKTPLSGLLPEVGNFGDIGKAENKIRAGTASNRGGLKNGDTYNGTPFPYRVWCGQLTEGQNEVVITSTIWEWDGAVGSSIYDWMAWFNQHNKDLQHADVKKAAVTMNAEWGAYMQAGAKLTEMWTGAVVDMKNVLGDAKDRPIGLAADGSFVPRSIILTYGIAEKALSAAMFGPPGTFSIRYKEPPGKLNGDYTIKGLLKRVSNPQECKQWP